MCLRWSYDYGLKVTAVRSQGPAGRSVGRFAGEVTRTMTVDESGTWTVTGTVTVMSDTYSWALDAGIPGAVGAITPNVNHPSGRTLPNFVGREMRLDYNRTYHFTAYGVHPQQK